MLRGGFFGLRNSRIDTKIIVIQASALGSKDLTVYYRCPQTRLHRTRRLPFWPSFAHCQRPLCRTQPRRCAMCAAPRARRPPRCWPTRYRRPSGPSFATSQARNEISAITPVKCIAHMDLLSLPCLSTCMIEALTKCYTNNANTFCMLQAWRVPCWSRTTKRPMG